MGKLPKKEPATKRKRSFVSRKLWPVIRQLTPAEGLALVCLTGWVKPETGVAQASDRLVCNQTGVSRDVMKRLRRKLAGLGIPVTPGDYLSHDSCSYDFRKVLDAATSSEARRIPERSAIAARRVGPVKVPPGLGAKSTHPVGANGAPLEGANGTEGVGAKSTQVGPEGRPHFKGERPSPHPLPTADRGERESDTRATPLGDRVRADPGVSAAGPGVSAAGPGVSAAGPGVSSVGEACAGSGAEVGEASQAWDAEAYADLSIHAGAPPESKGASVSQPIPAAESTGTTTLRDHGATPEWELTASAQTAPALALDFWDDSLEREVEARRAQLRIPLEEPSPPPLPPYEQWISRR